MMEVAGERGAAPHPEDLPGSRQRAEIAALYVLAVVVYTLLGQRFPVPMIAPDEYTYGHLAQSIAHGDGLTWRGAAEPLRAALYVVAVAPAWLAGSGVSGYALAKLLGAALVCAVVVPSWWLARRVVGHRLALLAAALAVAGPALLVAGEIVTENLAYPLAAAALTALVVALREPQRRWVLLALGFALAAAASRVQLAVLVPVVLVAALADAARRGPSWRATLDARRPLLLASGGLTVAGGVLALVARDTVLGTYAGITTTPPLSRVAADTGHQLIGLVTSLGILPAILVVAISSRRAAWRDPWLGPLLVVLWTATAALVLQSAWAVAGFDTPWHVERYVMYVLPLAFLTVLAGTQRGLLRPRAVLATAALLGAALLLAPDVREVEEELSAYSAFDIGDGALGASTAVSLALAAVLSGGAAALAMTRRGLATPARQAAVVGCSCLALLVVLDVPAWTWKTDVARGWRAIFPRDLAWVDGQRGAPLARILGAANASTFEVGEFFNRDIAQTFVPENPIGGRVVRGRACAWHAGADGTLSFDRGCGPAPARFYLDDFYAKFTFYDQRIVQDRPPVARIVAIAPPARPRLRALFFPACGPPLPIFAVDGRGPTVGPRRRACEATRLGGRFWLDAPATLVLRWRGGRRDQQATIGSQVYALPAGRATSIRLPVPARAVSFAMDLGWRGAGPLDPELVSARLTDAATSTELLY